MPTAVQVSGLRSFPSTFLRHWKMKETNRRGNEAGQPENACRGVIETLPVGVIPYREAYLVLLHSTVSMITSLVSCRTSPVPRDTLTLPVPSQPLRGWLAVH